MITVTGYKLDNYYARVNKSKIYVDYVNNSAKIVSFYNISVQGIIRLIYFASKQHLGKITCNCDTESLQNFIKAGFQLEGKIDGYFNGKNAFCMSYFIIRKRKICSNHEKEEMIIKESLNMQNKLCIHRSFKCHIRYAEESDAKDIVKLFSSIFSNNADSIFDEEYLRRIINKKVLYKVAVYDGKIIGAASANIDRERLNAEISNCVTYPRYRGKGVMSSIISSLQMDLKNMGFMTLYSFSRAAYPDINFVLSRQGYKFRGRLINNCIICGNFEDMNIWVKNIN